MSQPMTIGYVYPSSPVTLLPAMCNRHGLIAGATGTGKTVTLKMLAEQFSAQGTPVFMVDVKGDLSGFGAPGSATPKLQERLQALNITEHRYTTFPVAFWDLAGQQGHPVRTTVSEMGPLILSRLLDLNPTQSSLLEIAFQIADEEGLLLLDLKDLRQMLKHMAENAKTLSDTYGGMSAVSLNAIQRQLTSLSGQGGDTFFGEPALIFTDLLKTNAEGKGLIHILAADQLILQPKLYASFLLWILSECYESLPEVGDVDKPKFVLFFDEAHLMFEDVPEALLDKVTQVVRLIRSKGVGVFFVTQNPQDIAESVLGQLGNRFIHALRVFSPKDKKSVKSLADGFPENPALGNLADVIPELAVGEALVSTLDASGQPTLAQKVMIAPPQSFIGALSSDVRQQCIQQSLYAGQYDTVVDRESAFEFLKKRAEKPEPALVAAPQKTTASSTASSKKRAADDPMGAFFKSVVRAAGSQIGREITRSLLGGLKGR